MSHKELVIKYDGQELATHKMDLSLVVDSLTGLSSLISEVNSVVNGSSDGIEVKVKAFNPGSFEYILDVVQNPGDHIDILSTIGLFGAGGAATLMSVLEAINSRKIERIVFSKEGDCLVFLKDVDDPIRAPSYFKALLSAPGVRSAISKLIHAPLSKDGVESFGVYKSDDVDRSAPLVAVGKEESNVFKKPHRLIEGKKTRPIPFDDAIITFDMVKKDSQTWKIHFQDEPVSAVIKDKNFISSLLAGNEPDIFSSAYSAKVIVEENVYNSLDKTYIVDTVHGTLS
ncbi:hypothetical protein BCU39_000125 [Vibrio cyclitrophicus]|uniref:hypothetical protein n=1 Tax=Vibrio cyclitrophicus TaxID=47951 RepID=UPI000C853F84|nr:hypothetical protein [Vibrio cyclitrophicus]